MKNSHAAWFLRILIPLVVLFATNPAQGEIIERVVAVVNDEAVLLSDLRLRAAPFLEQAFEAPTETERYARLTQIYRQLLDHLIDDLLVQQAGRRLNIHVTQRDVEQAITNVRQQSGLELNAFWQAVRAQGFTEAQYRVDVERQLLRLKVLNQRARGRVNITDEDIRRRYDETVRASNRKLRFQASHVFFRLAKNANATEVARVRRLAEEVRKDLTQENFSEAISQHDGGALGWLTQGDLPSALEQALLTLEPGQISEPVRSDNGIHVLLLHQRERGDAAIPPYEEAKTQIYRHMLEAAMARQERVFLEELRKQAVVTRRL